MPRDQEALEEYVNAAFGTAQTSLSREEVGFVKKSLTNTTKKSQLYLSGTATLDFISAHSILELIRRGQPHVQTIYSRLIPIVYFAQGAALCGSVEQLWTKAWEELQSQSSYRKHDAASSATYHHHDYS